MRVCFWHSDKPREHLLADAFVAGVAKSGDTWEKRPLQPDIEVAASCDVACMVGVKSRELFQAHWKAGIHTVYLDKGYTRHAAEGPVKLWEYWRVALDAHHPTHRMEKMPPRPSDRMDELGLVMQPWRKKGEHILLAGSSLKYHDFYGLHHPTRWASKLVKEIKLLTDREIVYRPKPSWREAVPLDGTTFRPEGTIEEALAGAHCLITHGSNAVFEAVLNGIPCIVLGDAVAKPISSVTLQQTTIDTPLEAPYGSRYQWLANLAYWQWTLPEMAEGRAWEFLRPQIFG